MTTQNEFPQESVRGSLVRWLLSFVFWRNLFIGLVVASPLLIRYWMVSLIPDIPEPFDADEFCRVVIAPGENAFDHYREAFRLKQAVDAARNGENNEALWANYDEVMAKGWSHADDQLKKWLEDYRATMIEWRMGTDCPNALYIPMSEIDFWTELPVTPALREMARIAQCDAVRKEHEVDFHKAGQLWVSILRSSRHASKSGLAVDRLTGRAIHHWATQGINNWGASSRVTKEMLSSCYAQVRSADLMSQPVSSMLKAEYVAARNTLRRPDWIQFDATGNHDDADFVVYAKHVLYWTIGEPLNLKRLQKQILANQLPQIDKPLPERLPVTGTGRVLLFQSDPEEPPKPRHLSPPEIDRALQRSKLSRLWISNIKFAVDVIARERGQQATMELTLLLQMYRRDHDEFPEELSSLFPEYVDALPVDPCDPTGELIRYRRDGPRSAVIWSVGPNGVDDGGEVSDTRSGNSIDVGFVVSGR